MRGATAPRRLVLGRLLGRTAQDLVAQGLERVGHLVQRRRGDDEQAEAGEQQQHRDGQPRRQSARERVAEQEADEAALVVGRLRALHDVQHPEAAEGEREPAHDEASEAAGGRVLVLLRRGEHPPGAEQQQRRQEQRAPAEHRGEGLVDGLAGLAGVPPRAAGGDEGEREQQQAEAVAAVGRVDALRAVTGGRQAVAEEPDGAHEHAAERPQHGTDPGGDGRERAAALGLAGGGPAGRRALGRRAVPDVLRPPLPLRGRVVVDVRLAMRRTLPPRTTRHCGPRRGHAADAVSRHRSAPIMGSLPVPGALLSVGVRQRPHDRDTTEGRTVATSCAAATSAACTAGRNRPAAAHRVRPRRPPG